MQNTVNQSFKHNRQIIFSVVIAYLAVGSSMIFAGSVDDRTLPIWTNYLNSKFSVNGPSQEEWSRNRGNTADDLVELRNDPEGLKLKALAIAALAEADGHALEAKKILDQVGSEKRKKLKTDFIKPPSPQSNGR